MQNHLPRCLFYCLFACVFSLMVVATAAAADRSAVVTLNTGRQLEGAVVNESLDTITILISGINTKIKRTDIRSVKFLKTTDEEYKERRAKIADSDVDSRYTLARWLYDKKSYTLALKELNELAKLSPDEDRVGLLRRVVLLKLGDNTPTPPPTTTPDTNPNTPPKTGGNTETTSTGPLPTKMLDEESINKLKVFELNFDAKPKLFIPRNVLEEFIKDYSKEDGIPNTPNEKREFLRKKADDHLRMMFEVRARDYYGKVQVRDDPPVFAAFRQKVHRNVVINYCAAAKCHGSASAGPMFLFNRGANSPTVMYTNFYILHKYKNKEGYMLDRDFPDRSLLLTYGLPANGTNTPHPEVPGWQPLFRTGTKDRVYQSVVSWVGSLYKPVPQYDVKYAPPTLPSRFKKVVPKATDDDTKKDG